MPMVPLMHSLEKVPKGAEDLDIHNYEEQASQKGDKKEKALPTGWVKAGSVYAHAMPNRKVTYDTATMIAQCAIKYIGGQVTEQTGRVLGARYYELVIESDVAGKVRFGITTNMSKSAAFKEMGCRVYIRGVGDLQATTERVRAMMDAIAHLTSS